MATHFHWPDLMESKYDAKVAEQCSSRRNGHPDLQAVFIGWPPCLYKDLQLFLFCHMYPHIWAYIFFFLCKRKKKPHPSHNYSQLFLRDKLSGGWWNGIAQRFLCCGSFFFLFSQCPSAHIQRRDKTRPNLLPPRFMELQGVFLPSLDTLRSEKRKSPTRAVIYFASHLFSASRHHFLQEGPRLSRVDLFFSEVTFWSLWNSNSAHSSHFTSQGEINSKIT